MAVAFLSPLFSSEDAVGAPLVSGKLYTYAAGTTTPQTTYQDAAGSVANTNPIGLNARGEAVLFLTAGTNYKFVLKTAADVTVWTQDDIVGPLSTASLSGSSGSSNVGWIQSGSGAVARTLQSRLRDTVNAFDFMTVAQIADVQAGTLAEDVTSPIQNAITALPANGGSIYCPPGQYLVSSKLVLSKRVLFIGAGTSLLAADVTPTLLVKKSTMTSELVEVTAGACGMEHIGLKGQAGNTGAGIQVSAGRFYLNDVCVYSMGGDGIRVGTDAGVNANVFAFYNIKCKSNGGHGVHLSDKTSPTLADANGGAIFGADLQSNTDAGLRITNAQLNSFYNIVSQSNTGRGISLGAGADYNFFFGGDSESNSGDEIHLEAGASYNTFHGGVVTGSITDNGTGTVMLGLQSTAASGIGRGVYLSNVAASDTRTLDWYEEGTFTPVLTFSTPGDVAVTYSAQIGRYTRIGNRCTISVSVITSAFTHTTASGDIRISGLPFTSRNLSNVLHCGACQYAGVTAATTPSVVARVAANSTIVNFLASGSGVANVNLATTQVASGGTPLFIFTVTYEVE
jgi:hypothetical protein